MWRRKKKNKHVAYGGQRSADSKELTAIRYPLNALKAFTLLELVVTTSIVAMIGAAILATFSSGFHVYQRIQNYGGVQADVYLSLEKMERDLRQAFHYSGIDFEGEIKKIAFPVMIHTVDREDEEDVQKTSLGKISYYIDEEGTLVEKQQDYSQAVSEVGTVGDEDTSNDLAFIEDLNFSYYFYNDEDEKYAWQDTWSTEDEGIPKGVRIEVTFKNSEKDIQLVRTVLIPAGGVLFVEEQGEDEGGGEEEGEGEGEE